VEHGQDETPAQVDRLGKGLPMFTAMSYQTLSTGTRPFYAMKRYIHPALA